MHHIKDQRTTHVTISPSLVEILEDYWIVSPHDTGYIFMSNKGNPLSNTSYSKIITKYLKLAGLKDTGATGHSFRHTFIMNIIKNNISLYKIIEYTGHRSVDALKSYVNLRPHDCDDLVAVAEKYSLIKPLNAA